MSKPKKRKKSKGKVTIKTATSLKNKHNNSGTIGVPTIYNNAATIRLKIRPK